ncbi:MAG TPA: hypothetical protein VJ919_17790 [Tangfeifania sp.]|nr:hypothetical protein [Tangfeifania sp.]
MLKKTAQIISVLFHPVLLPTLGFLLMFNSGFYFSYLSWEAKRYVLMVVLFTTGILPLLSVALLALKPKFDISLSKVSDRLMVLLFTSAFYYLGFVLLDRIKAYPVFKLVMIASVLVIIALLLISFKWKISSHMAALGGITGAVLALAFRTGINPVFSVLVLVLAAGLTGTSRLIVQKNSLAQVVAGYFLGLIIVYLVIYFV